MSLRINLDQAVCRTEFSSEAHLWDAELDGGVRNARGETRRDRQARHERARPICHQCPQMLVCREVGLKDPIATGIYGGVLVDELRRPTHVRLNIRPAGNPRLPADTLV